MEGVLLLRAFCLARKAQAMSRRPLVSVVEGLAAGALLPRGCRVEDAIRISARATYWGCRIMGWRRTCIVQSAVAAALLSDREGVEIVLGFRRVSGKTPAGHAWVTIDGVPADPGYITGDDAFVVVSRLPVCRHDPRRSQPGQIPDTR
jgi:hypothetical protein